MRSSDDSDSRPTTRWADESDASDAATLLRTDSAQGVSVGDRRIEVMDFSHRYAPDKVLGEGGMGVVTLFHDRQIGRRIAIKVVRRGGDRDAEGRFLREARVQGQLEHPAVVPVYDLGLTPDGAAYFSMKRVRGVTLEEVVRALRSGDPEASNRYSRRRLLAAFNSVCLAVDFAHEHGVVHRDLKPANVMLGDFGEVYVLDWGLAKIVGAEDVTATGRVKSLDVELRDTVAGSVLGTPGYMAPEQMRGDIDRVGPASDVYALGAILFELLTLHPLHDGRSLQSLVESTLDGIEARPSVRFAEQDIAPELEALIVRATTLDPLLRFDRARELSEALERYLDGERDVERRREMAELHAGLARQSVDRARSEQGQSFEERRRAMREVGRALALDPGNQAAIDSMVALLSEPPRTMPHEVRLSIEANERYKLRWIGKVGGVAYASLLLYLPLLLWVGVRAWSAVLVVYVLAALASGISFWTGSRREPPQWSVVVVLAVSSVLFMSTTIFFGPLVLPPLLIAINTTVFTLYLPPRYRTLSVMAGGLAVLTPNVLWLAGVLPGYRIESARIVFDSVVLQGSPVPMAALMLAAVVGAVITGALAVTRVRDALARTEQQIILYAWHLRELVPEAVRGPTDPTPARRAALPAEARR
jgi:eukaryotic-like serine/threonine-protein kinase